MNNRTSQLNNRFYIVSYSIFIFLNLSFIIFCRIGSLGKELDPHGYGMIIIGTLIGLINFILCSVILTMLFFKNNKHILLFALLAFLNPFILFFTGEFTCCYNALIILLMVIDIICERKILKEEWKTGASLPK